MAKRETSNSQLRGASSRRGGSGRDRLIDAARELFWENGFESTSPHDLYAFSGVGQGSFYHHFTGKLDLLHAVLEDVASEKIGVLDQLTAAATSPLACLRSYLALDRDGCRGCRLGRFAYESSIAKPEVHGPIRRYLEAAERFISTHVNAAQEAGELSDHLDASTITSLMLTAVQGGYILARAHRNPQWLEESLSAASRLLESQVPAGNR